jgi:uncharacterized membrane protein
MDDDKKTVEAFDQKDIEENKYIAAIGYLWILCLVPLLLKKESPFAQEHGKQGLVLCVLWFLSWVPLVGWILVLPLLIVNIIAIVQSLSGNYWKIPVIHDLGKKINL